MSRVSSRVPVDTEAYAAGFRAALNEVGLNRDNVVDRAVGPMLAHLHTRGYHLADDRGGMVATVANSFTDGFLDEAEQEWRQA